VVLTLDRRDLRLEDDPESEAQRLTDDSLDSTKTFNALLERGVIVKDCSVSFRGLGKRYLRIDVSLKKHMDRLADALRDIDSRPSVGKG